MNTINEIKNDFTQDMKMDSADFWEANSDSTENFDHNKITIGDLKQKLSIYYEPNIIHRYSSALDIIASFTKAQAFLYNESCVYCKYRLNFLMFPCIFLSTICSTFSMVSQNSPNGFLFIAVINAVISFLLAIVNYLKLDAAAEAHHISSTHFSRLKTLLEFNSGEILLFEHPLLQQNGIEKEIENWKIMHTESHDCEKDIYIESLYKQKSDLENVLIKKIQEKISVLREKILEIKENNNYPIPKSIMNHYPIIYNINIFSFIKIVDDYRMGIIYSLKNIINEMKYISHKTILYEKDTERLKFLYEQKNFTIKELIMLSSSYNLVDSMFQQEIKNHYLEKQYYLRFWLNKIYLNVRLPDEYKNPYDCGYFDIKTNQSLLRKILNI